MPIHDYRTREGQEAHKTPRQMTPDSTLRNTKTYERRHMQTSDRLQRRTLCFCGEPQRRSLILSESMDEKPIYAGADIDGRIGLFVVGPDGRPVPLSLRIDWLRILETLGCKLGEMPRVMLVKE